MIDQDISFLTEINEHWENRYKVKARSERIKYVDERISFVVGMRRIGKTSLLRWEINHLTEKTHPKNILYLDFFDPLLSEYRDYKKLLGLISAYLSKERINPNELYLFIDEVQQISEWHLVVEKLRQKGIKVVATGSNSSIFSKKLGYLLTGRYVKLELFSLNFGDFLRWKEIALSDEIELLKEKKIKNLFNEYFISSLPEYVLKQDKQIIRETYVDILNKDIFYRHNIKEKIEMEELAWFLLNEVGNHISYNSLSKLLKISDKTVKEFIRYLEDAYLFYTLPVYSHKTKEQIASTRKIYIADNSFPLFIKTNTTFNKGKLMENIAFIHLRRNLLPYQHLFYYKTPQGYEVDFLIKEGTQIKELIQVTYANSRDEVKEREIRALLHAKEDLNLSDDVPLTVITWDYEDAREEKWFGMHGKIRFVPLWKWLLNPSATS